MHNGKLYGDYLNRQKKIDNLIKDINLTGVQLASLLRLREKVKQEHHLTMFMQSEFAGIEIEKALELGYLSREYRKFEWHPKEEGTFYYGLTEQGSKAIDEALQILLKHNVEIYY